MYPTYIVKFSEKIDFGHCAVVYEHTEGRNYVGRYGIAADDGSFEDLGVERSGPVFMRRPYQGGYYSYKGYTNNLVKPRRFNKIIGDEGFPVQECFFFDKKEFAEEFFSELLG
jgi:hypothetical protein